MPQCQNIRLYIGHIAAVVRTFAVGRAVDAAHPPIKVLLTDGVNQGRVRPVEQVLLIHRRDLVPLLHLLFLPEHTIPGM